MVTISKLINFYQTNSDLYFCQCVIEELKEVMFKKNEIKTSDDFKRIVNRIERIMFDMGFKVINSIPKNNTFTILEIKMMIVY